MTRTRAREAVVPTTAAMLLASLLLPPTIAQADHHEESSVAAEVKAMILENNRYIRENLEDPPGDTSKLGSMEFWSSGGLMQWTAGDAPASQWESFSLNPKHVHVIELPGGQAAVALYYSEGSMQPKGRPPVSHYMTRVLQVFVKEDGEWRARAGHWSPVAAGAGTSQASLD